MKPQILKTMMPLKALFTTLTVFLSLTLFSQTYIGRGEVFDDFFLQKNNSQSTSSIDGSSCFNEEWAEGKVVLGSGKEYLVESFKYDIYSNRLLFLNKSVEYYIPESEKVNEFSIGESHFICSGNADYYEVISSGNKIELLKKYKCTIIEGKSDNGIIQATNDKFGINFLYFVKMRDGKMTKLTVKKKPVIELLSDKKEKISKFIKKNKLKVRKEKDLAALFNYYNSIN
jgi:hypothetical protein